MSLSKSAFFSACVFGCCSLVQATEISSSRFSGAPMFSLTTEEMVFASKLSDENRREFCYRFSLRERVQAMHREDLSPDESVADIIAVGQLPHSVQKQ